MEVLLVTVVRYHSLQLCYDSKQPTSSCQRQTAMYSTQDSRLPENYFLVSCLTCLVAHSLIF